MAGAPLSQLLGFVERSKGQVNMADALSDKVEPGILQVSHEQSPPCMRMTATPIRRQIAESLESLLDADEDSELEITLEGDKCQPRSRTSSMKSRRA